MKRRALIIYCNNTSSGPLPGPEPDNRNLINHLTSSLGGDWLSDEIMSLSNPTIRQVDTAVSAFLNGADYTFVVFTGHGYINSEDSDLQYMEVRDGDISIRQLLTSVKRQTIIIDACRGYLSPSQQELTKGLSSHFENFSARQSTRQLFERGILNAEEGITVLYSASENQSSSDSKKGAAYLFSILKVCDLWEESDKSNSLFTLKDAHEYGTKYMKNNFITNQEPTMNSEKRMRYFPLAVKFTRIFG